MGGRGRPGRLRRWVIALLVIAPCLGCGASSTSAPAVPPASQMPFFPQWAQNPQHTGMVGVTGASFQGSQADIVYDPFVAQEQAESEGELLAHYQAVLVDGSDFYMEVKSGTYPSCSPPGSWTGGAACGPNAWDQLQWGVVRYTWQGGSAASVWTFQSDWTPPPNGQGLNGWEPVFHPVLANRVLYVPGKGGSVWKVDKDSGVALSNPNPVASAGTDAANTFVAGPLTADGAGNIYYNVIWLAPQGSLDPWLGADVMGAWLVRVGPDDSTARVAYTTLVPGAPAPGAACPGSFSDLSTLPWPPSPTAVPAPILCGSQRPGLNVAPAVAPDGTIYTVSRAHFDGMAAYLVAVGPDLTPRWQASLQRRFADGCGVIVPIGGSTTEPNTCRPGSARGVDPTTNDLGSGSVVDQSSSSPTVLPDGSVVYGAMTFYNAYRGHLMKFDAQGHFLMAYDFGWDTTPAVYPHGGTYSIVLKDNHYDSSLYCPGNAPLCPNLPKGPYFISQLGSGLEVEWQFQSPTNHEWCVNAPVIDASGNVYAGSEDGSLYAIPQGHGVFSTPAQSFFLRLALGAAYTPVAMGPDGRAYSQNDGHLFVVGSP